jgi:type I restriction enzyme S subunit
MQNLFPTNSITNDELEITNVPNYRFPEFLEDGDWVEKKLGEMVHKVGSGSTPLGGQSVYKISGRPFVRSQNVGWGILLLENIAFIDEETHQNSINTEIEIEDVLLNITGASIGRSSVANQHVCGGNVNQHVCIIRTQKMCLNPFLLCQYLISVFGQKQIDSFQAGGNRQGLNFQQIRSLLIPTPPSLSEQQKIASCLSSLDDLITAQTEKIAQLKLHKKGLMQGLFPRSITN